MILESDIELDRLYVECVKNEVIKKYSIVKNIILDKNEYILTIEFKKDFEDFVGKYFEIRLFIDRFFPGVWFGDLTYLNHSVYNDGRIKKYVI